MTQWPAGEIAQVRLRTETLPMLAIAATEPVRRRPLTDRTGLRIETLHPGLKTGITGTCKAFNTRDRSYLYS